MKLDTDGLDGVLFFSVVHNASPSSPPKVPVRPQKTALAPPKSSPSNGRQGRAPLAKSVRPVRPSPSGAPPRRPRTLEVSSTMQEAIPQKQSTVSSWPMAVLPTQSMQPVPAPLETMEPVDLTPETASRDSQWRPERKRYIPFVVTFLAAVIAGVAAFMGGVFQSTSEPDVVYTVPLKTVTPGITQTKVASAEKEPQKELEKSSELEESHNHTKQESVEAGPTEVSDEKRFPGTYLRGQIRPQDAAWAKVNDVLRSMRHCKSKVVISGHACSLGDDPTNHYVSRKRAEVVASYFLKRGFERKQLVVRGMGATIPIADNKTDQGRILNRRVGISCR